MTMARWIVKAYDGGISVTHRRPDDRREFLCGWATVSADRALEWVVHEGHWCPGDSVDLPDGSLLVFALRRGRA